MSDIEVIGVGSGVAGLAAALTASKRDARVVAAGSEGVMGRIAGHSAAAHALNPWSTARRQPLA